MHMVYTVAKNDTKKYRKLTRQTLTEWLFIYRLFQVSKNISDRMVLVGECNKTSFGKNGLHCNWVKDHRSICHFNVLQMFKYESNVAPKHNLPCFHGIKKEKKVVASRWDSGVHIWKSANDTSCYYLIPVQWVKVKKSILCIVIWQLDMIQWQKNKESIEQLFLQGNKDHLQIICLVNCYITCIFSSKKLTFTIQIYNEILTYIYLIFINNHWEFTFLM